MRPAVPEAGPILAAQVAGAAGEREASHTEHVCAESGVGSASALFRAKAQRMLAPALSVVIRQREDLVEVVSGLNPEDLVIDHCRAKLEVGRRAELVDAGH